jgi:hypothetical protein
MRWREVPPAAWRTPQELVQEGFRRSRAESPATTGRRWATTSPPWWPRGLRLLDRYGGTAGLLLEEAGPLSCWPGVDALIVSTDNAMT